MYAMHGNQRTLDALPLGYAEVVSSNLTLGTIVFFFTQCNISTMKRVLVIDDDEMARETTKDVLQHAGFSVASVDNAKDAIALLEREKFDLVLVDYQMPVMNGIEFCRVLRSKDTVTKIALLTASGYSRDVDAEISGLGAEFIRKPFMSSELISRVRRLVG